MELTSRLNNTQVLRTYQNMIRTAPTETVLELKANLESEVDYRLHRHKQILDEEFNKRLDV